jgi:hypothetical protein
MLLFYYMNFNGKTIFIITLTGHKNKRHCNMTGATSTDGGGGDGRDGDDGDGDGDDNGGDGGSDGDNSYINGYCSCCSLIHIISFQPNI